MPKITFSPPKYDFEFQGPKVTKTGLVCKIHISHVTKLVWVPINFYYEGVLQVQILGSHHLPFLVYQGGTTTPPIPSMPGVDVSQRRVKPFSTFSTVILVSKWSNVKISRICTYKTRKPKNCQYCNQFFCTKNWKWLKSHKILVNQNSLIFPKI